MSPLSLLAAAENRKVPIGEADLFVFAYVLHENASFLEADGRLLKGTLLYDVLLKARRGAMIMAVDSGDRLWPSVREGAEGLGWEVEDRVEVSMGPRSFLTMMRVEVKDAPTEKYKCTVSEVIFDPAKHFKRNVEVEAVVRNLIPTVSRFDLSDGRGGKLIVDAAALGSLPRVEEAVRVAGEVKKRQRRTVLVATSVRVLALPVLTPTQVEVPPCLPMLVAPWLQAGDLSSLAMVSKVFEAECSENSYWRARAEADFNVKRHGKQAPGFWRKLYLEVHAEQIEEDTLVSQGMC